MVFANGKRKLLPLIPLIAALAACGGGGGGGSTTTTTTTTTTGTGTGLTMPVTMSALAAPTTTTAAPAVRGLTTNFYGASKAATVLTSFPATSNIATDESHTYEWDASMQSLQTVNMILCLMDQTKASAMVNKGAYIALVNEDKCEQGQNGSSSGSSGQSSGKVVSLNKWTIESTRADNSSYQYVKIWVPGRGGTDPKDNQTVLVYVTIKEGVSATKPYGDFDLDFNGVATINGTSVAVMKGKLKTVPNTTPQFQFFNVEGDYLLGGSSLGFGYQQDANVILSDATSTASSNATTHVKMTETNTSGTFSDEATFKIAANPNLVLREKTVAGSGATQACMSRTNFNRQVWRYNLYYDVTGPNAANAGKRVTLNSGFPFTYNGSNGFVGYWGVWLEGSATLPDGASINKMNYSTGASTPYTVHVAKGKLIKRTANTATLASLQGQDFNWWGQDPTLVTTNFGQYQVTVSSATNLPPANRFMVTGSVSWGSGSGPTITPLTTPVDITPSLAGQTLWLWSDALGGNVTYVSGAANATYYAQEFIQPTGITNGTVLHCYDRCVKGGLTDAAVAAAVPPGVGSLYYPTDGNDHPYTVSVANGKVTLTDNSNAGAAVDLSQLSATGLASLNSIGYNWGIQTGETVTDNTGYNAGNWWQIYSAPTSYRWETGPNNWNQMITVTDSGGTVASFDKPISINYTHSTADDANTDATYDGKKFLLQYGGDGELWGFPWVEDTANPGRWRSSVTLKDGVQLTDGAVSTTNFVVKAIEQEQTMKYADPAGTAPTCTGAPNNLTTATAPALALTTADLVTVSFGVADKPSVTTAPAVIEGVLQ